MSETNSIVQPIRLALSRGPCRLFRNNVGSLPDKNGRWVSYGLFPGSGDLIGWRTVRITPDMVGRDIAQFVSVECKRPGARTDKKRAEDQANWRKAVNDAGGTGVQVTSVDEAAHALGVRSP